MIKQAIANVLPRQLRSVARHIIHRYRTYARQRMLKIDETEFERIIRDELMVQSGDVVFVHSSVDNLNLAFPAYRVLHLLRETIGETGTLLFPCTHLVYSSGTETPFEYYRTGKIFDVKKSSTTSGLLSEFARRQPDAFRSLHPTHSVVAVGKRAQELTKDHGKSIFPFDEQSPYYRISNYDGVIVGVGVNTEYLTVVHCVEDILKERFPVKTYDPRLLDAKVRDRDGVERITSTLVHGKTVESRNIPKYLRKYIPKDICHESKIHGVQYYTSRARPLISRMEELALKGITIYTV
jgi:aminoglycoside 3-N-acetyltransferase